jgi:hypothetical protein
LSAVEEDGRAQVWRVDTPVRRSAVAVSRFFVLLALVATAIGDKTSSSVFMWAFAVLVMLLVWRWYIVPYVALTPDHVVVRGVFARRTVGYGTIRRVLPGLYGVRIETEDQGAVTAWAVQKSKFSEWTHRHTRADDMAAAIMDRVHASDSAHGAHDAADAHDAGVTSAN